MVPESVADVVMATARTGPLSISLVPGKTNKVQLLLLSKWRHGGMMSFALTLGCQAYNLTSIDK